MFGLGPAELILILLVMLLFFRQDKLPELARCIGKSVKELKAGFEKTTDAVTTALDTKKETCLVSPFSYQSKILAVL